MDEARVGGWVYITPEGGGTAVIIKYNDWNILKLAIPNPAPG
jgi:hypothetical protein